MYWDVKKVRPMDDYQIYVELEDGRKGLFDLKPYLDHGVFKELKNKAYFSQVDVMFGAISCSWGQVTAPETLLAGLKPLEGNNAKQGA